MAPWFSFDVVVGVFNVLYGFREFCFNKRAAFRTPVAVLPLFAVLTVGESSEASAEVPFGWFCFSSSSSGNSNRPRNKDVVVVLVWAVVGVFSGVECVVVDWDMVES